MALIYIFKWDFGQLVPSNLSKVCILNLGGNLTLGKSENDWYSMRSSILRALMIISSILFILSLIFFSLSMVGGLWLALFFSLLLFRFWNYFTIRFMSSLNWIWLATMVLSSFWVFMGSSVFRCSPSSAIVLGSSNFLWLELSCRSNMGLWCYSSGVSSMLTDFSVVIEGMGLELELLAWVSVLGFLWSLPFNLDQILP